MTKPVTIPNTFATASGNVPAVELDANYNALRDAINDVGTYSTGNTDTGAANAYVVATPSGLTFSRSTYVRVQWVIAHSNTAASTLNYGGSGAAAIVRPDGSALQAGDLTASMIADTMWTGSQWQLMSTPPSTAAPANVPTGSVFPYVGATAPTGYVLAAGGTIGSGASAATERANADTATLYALIWNSWANAQAPVSTGRGANAAADFAANKTITVPDLRGRAAFGIDNMGPLGAANRITVGGSGISGVTMGASGGDQLFQSHGHAVTDPGHAHGEKWFNTGGGIGGGKGAAFGFTNANAGTDVATNGNTASNTTGVAVSNAGGGASQNVPPAMMLSYIVAL